MQNLQYLIIKGKNMEKPVEFMIDDPLADGTGGGGGTGADGKSAYDIWLEQGNEGTEQDFLDSLKGEKGDKGDSGEPGEKGDKGDSGADGYTPVRGTDYWTEEDKAEIKAYVDEAILGGEW